MKKILLYSGIFLGSFLLIGFIFGFRVQAQIIPLIYQTKTNSQFSFSGSIFGVYTNQNTTLNLNSIYLEFSSDSDLSGYKIQMTHDGGVGNQCSGGANSYTALSNNFVFDSTYNSWTAGETKIYKFTTSTFAFTFTTNKCYGFQIWDSGNNPVSINGLGTNTGTATSSIPENFVSTSTNATYPYFTLNSFMGPEFNLASSTPIEPEYDSNTQKCIIDLSDTFGFTNGTNTLQNAIACSWAKTLENVGSFLFKPHAISQSYLATGFTNLKAQPPFNVLFQGLTIASSSLSSANTATSGIAYFPIKFPGQAQVNIPVFASNTLSNVVGEETKNKWFELQKYVAYVAVVWLAFSIIAL